MFTRSLWFAAILIFGAGLAARSGPPRRRRPFAGT